MKEELRSYLNGRVELGDPELVFPSLGRKEALRRIRELAAGRARLRTVGRARPAEVQPAGDGRSAATTTTSARESALALPENEVRRLAREGEPAEIRRLPDLATFRAVALQCTRCPLHESRRSVVFGEGDPAARVLCVGEAPGAREDETGRPFVGRAGQLLDRLLLSAGFPRKSVYICNVLKCRPPGNRNPRPEEIEACSSFLLGQVREVHPRVIVAFGTFAARTLLETRESLGRLRGRTHIFRGYPVVVTYHPAALLRNPGWTRPTWEDLQRVRRLADEEGGPVG